MKILDPPLFLYEDWLNKRSVYICDLLNPPHPQNSLNNLLFIMLLTYTTRGSTLKKLLAEQYSNRMPCSSDLNKDVIFDRITVKKKKNAYVRMLYSRKAFVF